MIVDVHHINGQKANLDSLLCERRTLPGNDYHGNVVYREHVTPTREKMIAAALAVSCELIKRSPPDAPQAPRAES